jgi:hypothetical protein
VSGEIDALRAELEAELTRVRLMLRSFAGPAFVTSLRVEVLGAHAHVSVWVRGKLAGELVVDAEDSPVLVAALAGPETKIERE